MSIYEYEAKTIDGKNVSLKAYQGQALLIVNVASECGFTPQYTELENLFKKYRTQGFQVLGFPCDQFGNQEPGSEAEIKQFCETRFKVTFPLFSKIEVNGPNTHPLYQHLKSSAKGLLGSEAIKWNFTKFLVDQKGEIVKRFAPQVNPKEIEPEIEKVLGQA